MSLQLINWIKTKLVELFCTSIILAVASYTFGWAGFLVISACIALFWIPFYLILTPFDLTSEEKSFYSFFIGIGLFPFLTYIISQIIPSLKLSVIISFVALLTFGLTVQYFHNKKKVEIN